MRLGSAWSARGWKALSGSLVMVSMASLVSIASLSACGGMSAATSASAANRPASAGVKVVDIYSSLPMRGPAASQTLAMANGIRLALAESGGRAGRFTIDYTALDDSAGPAGWDASRTVANARRAAADPRAVYYIGEFDDDASEVSMPILNHAGTPQVSPASTYVGLTTGPSGDPSSAGDPFAPTGKRTFLRIVPSDAVQAAALLEAIRQAGCPSVGLVSDQDGPGDAMAKLVELQKRRFGVSVVSDAAVDPAARNLGAFVATLAARHPGCILLTGMVASEAVRLTDDVHAALPAARIFGPGAMCTSAWTNPRNGGVPAAIDPLIECTAVTLSLSAYPGGHAFLAAYRARYATADPSPYAILGYEAMKLGLSTIAGLGSKGDSKSAVLSALFSITSRHSVLGTYGFDSGGDTTLRSYGLYRVGRTGDPVFVKTITPPVVG